MIGKTPKEHQMSIFEVAQESFIDMNHELVLQSKQIDWEAVESEFAEYYCADNGRPSVPIRKMVGMMLLKNIYNLSDEGVVARWMENPYMQYFTGEKVFQKRPPMNPVDMTKFRKRIGENPLSYDDTHTPVYKAEILGVLREIDIVKSIADTKKVICNGMGTNADEFKMLVVNGTNSECLDFTVMEEWTSFEISGIKRYKDVK